MAFVEKYWTWLAILAIAITAALTLGPLIALGLPETHEHVRYALLTAAFREALAHGAWPPRWLPFAYGGWGYPTFVFYQPGFFWLSALFGLRLAVWLGTCAGGLGAYAAARALAGRGASLLCALLFLLTPYAAAELTVRGDLSELLAMLLVPWPVALLLWRDRHRALPLAEALALAALVWSHPVTALFAWLLWAVLAVALRRDHLRTALVALLALAWAAPYAWHVAAMAREVNLQAATGNYFDPARHVVRPWQLLDPRWDWGISQPDAMPDTMSFQLGLVHLLIALGGLVAGWRDRRLRWLAAAYGVGVVAMTVPAPWHLPVLRQVQFPWRLLSVTATPQALLAAGLDRVPASARRRWAAGALAVAVAAALAWPRFVAGRGTLDAAAAVREWQGNRMNRLENFAAMNEFLPRTAPPAAAPRHDEPIASLDGPGTATPTGDDWRIGMQVTAPRRTALRIRQLWLPGWRVVLDGERLPDAVLRQSLERDGTMRVVVPPGRHALQAWYDGPAGWPLVDAGAVGVALLAGAALNWRRPES